MNASILAFLVIFFSISSSAHAVTRDGFNARNWLPLWVPSVMVEEIESKIDAEVRELTKMDENSNINYGISFPGLTEVKQNCLEYIQSLNRSNSEKPVVADIGAGFGNMTWKMLAAGARVDAYEMQVPTAEQIFPRIYQMNSQWWGGSAVKDILNVFSVDVLSLSENKSLHGKYDVIWAGHVMHFLSPKDFKKLSSFFYKLLKPKGRVFLEANTVFGFADQMTNGEILRQSYNTAVSEGIEFPGFMAINSMALFDNITQSVNEIAVSVVDAKTMLNRSDYQMCSYGNGFYSPDASVTLFEQVFSEMYPEAVDMQIYRSHQIMNFLDVTTANRIFRADGFRVLENFYYMPQGVRVQKNEVGSAIAVVIEKH